MERCRNASAFGRNFRDYGSTYSSRSRCDRRSAWEAPRELQEAAASRRNCLLRPEGWKSAGWKEAQARRRAYDAACMPPETPRAKRQPSHAEPPCELVAGAHTRLGAPRTGRGPQERRLAAAGVVSPTSANISKRWKCRTEIRRLHPRARFRRTSPIHRLGLKVRIGLSTGERSSFVKFEAGCLPVKGHPSRNKHAVLEYVLEYYS